MRVPLLPRWLTVGALCAAAACATNPATGERQISLVSEAQEIELGRESARQVEMSIGLVDDAELQRYVGRVGQSLARISERPDLPWQFQVVDDPSPNAFALPGGFIYVTRGMMALMRSEAELASVIGHEVGHVTARHSVSQISRQQLAQLGLGIGGLLVPEVQQYGSAIGAGLGLLMLRYGRDAEREADELGFRYAREDGYDVSEMADVFQDLARLGEQEGQGSALPSWLSTHPDPGSRVEAVNQRLQALPENERGGKVASAEYLRAIDGMVYGDNPRNGFFRDGRFVHPELRFAFEVPDDWQTQNLSRAVVAASPNGDAVLQLTLAGDTSATQAAQAFAAESGAQVGRASREQIHGIPAVVAPFQAATADATVQGIAAWLDYGGRTYQLVTYSSAARYGRYESTFEDVIGSFEEVRDPDLLNVKPMRVDVVSVDRDVSLRDFASNPPVPIETLAILNEVQGPASVLRAGTLAKRIVK